MSLKALQVMPLHEMRDGEEADCFVLLISKEEMKTRDGRPYWRVGFRDAQREVNFPIWEDATWAADCRDVWQVGQFFKVRAVYRETDYGPQLDIRKIREATDADREDGFDELLCQPASRYRPEEMFDDLIDIAREKIAGEPLRELVVAILNDHRAELLTLPAATHNHHAYVGGWLEHVRSVVQTLLYLVDKYDDYYPDLQPRLNKDVAIAGAILHDIGKLRELEQDVSGAAYTPSGDLIGHILQGRDIVREAAADTEIDSDTLLRLEHVIVSHQRLPEWGSPKPPMTPEALLVHYADDIDAKYHIFYSILRDDSRDGAMTSGKNMMRQKLYRGE